MTGQRTESVDPLAQHLVGRARVMNAVRGIVPATIAMPLILRVWSPTWFVVGWLGAYLAMSVFFCVVSLIRPSSSVEQSWSIIASVLFALVPVSAASWSGMPADFWAAATVCMVFVAFELSALPFLRIGEWRIGIALVAVATSVAGTTVVNPFVAISLTPLVLAMVHSADRIRKLKLGLEQHLNEAQKTIRHDPLTGLLNRRGLATRIDQLDGDEITIALIDVDRFKIINDTHGHQVGDQVLIGLGQELRGRLGPEFELARLGGDEFVAVASGGARLAAELARPTTIHAEGHGQPLALVCSFSIGVSRGLNADSGQRLLSEAGFAMRDAKRSGATLSRFGRQLSKRLDRTVQVAAIASGTEDEGMFVPVAQCVVTEQRIVGCELLIRWQRPDGELLLPDQFLPLAIDAGLMPVINDLMLGHAMRFASRFNNRPNAPFVSVNISASYLGDAQLYSRVETLLEEHRVPPERLMIEITETERLAGYDGWEAAAARLRVLGVNLAIDDFGTGYSSIERLQHLPISHLKFDRSLVQSVSGPFGEIVGGVSRFAKAVNIGIIAEGIETLDEFDSMRSFGISTFQGYLFHRPETLDEVEIRIIEDHLRATRSQPTS